MMVTFLLTFAMFVLVVFGMSLGWLIKRKAFRAAAAASPHWGWKKSAIARSRATRVKSVLHEKRNASRTGSSE